MVMCIGMDETIWFYMVLLFSSVLWLCLIVVIACFVVSISYGKFVLHKVSRPPDCSNLPGVSIIKPLKGIDENLHSNLESHFKLEYPALELLFCFEDSQDPAIELVKNLQNKYPEVLTQIFTGGKNEILNPLVNNMTPAYENCKYDLVWISTSRVKVNTDILIDMVCKIDNPKVALVHQMPFTADQNGLAAAIEKVYFGTILPRYNFMCQVFNLCCFTGMSYLVKKSELELINGLPWYGKYLAEDFFIANTLHEKGFRHQLSAIPAQQNITTSLESFRERMVRWQKLRINLVPLVGVVLEPIGESIPLSVSISLTLWHYLEINPLLCLSCMLLIWCLLDYVQLKGVQNGPLPFSIPKYVLAWTLRQVLFLFIFGEAITDWQHIKWGQKTFRLSNYGKSLQLVSRKGVLSL